MHYSDLTPQQKEYICNGCGGKGGWIKPPDFIFLASCNHHDFKFWLGHTLEHFYKANKDFYTWMKKDIESIAFYKDGMNWIERTISISKVTIKKSHYHIWAYAYYQAVNIGGKKYFHFADTCKTLADLRREMAIESNREQGEF